MGIDEPYKKDILNSKNILHVTDSFGPGNKPLGGSGSIIRAIIKEGLSYGLNSQVLVDRFVKGASLKWHWRRDGIEVFQYPLLRSYPKKVFPFGKTKRRQWIAKILFPLITNKIHPHITHLHMESGLLRFTLEFKKKIDTKVVVTSHGLHDIILNSENYHQPNYEPDWVKSIEAVDAWVGCAPLVSEGLVKWGIPKSKVFSIFNGTEVPVSLPLLSERKNQNDEFTIVFVGRMMEGKGIYDLANAAVKVSMNKKIKLIFVGYHTGEIKNNILSIVTKGNNHVKCEFTGEIGSSHVFQLLQSSDLFCHPSRYREGLPMSVLEAAAQGCPMILSDVPGHRSIFEPKHAVFYSAGNIQELTQAIEALIQSYNLRKEIRERAYQLVQKQYDQKRMLAQYMALYEALLTKTYDSA